MVTSWLVGRSVKAEQNAARPVRAAARERRVTIQQRDGSLKMYVIKHKHHGMRRESSISSLVRLIVRSAFQQSMLE